LGVRIVAALDYQNDCQQCLSGSFRVHQIPHTLRHYTRTKSPPPVLTATTCGGTDDVRTAEL